MSMNPYQAPAAATTDVAADRVDGYSGRIARLPAGAGAAWIGNAWEMFRASPGVWIGLVMVFALMGIGAGLVPLVGGLAWNVLFPIFFGGLMVAADGSRRGEPPSFGQLFEGFNRQTGQLALVGVLYLAGVLVVAIGAVLLVALLASLYGFRVEALRDGGDLSLLLVGLLFALVMLALTLPLLMAVWFAPALVILHEVPAFEAMKQSFLGCLANLGPFLVYGVVTLFLALLATLPLMLGWLVLGPLLVCSAHAGYRQIYCSE